MDAIGAIALGLLGAGLYLEDTDSNKKDNTDKKKGNVKSKKGNKDVNYNKDQSQGQSQSQTGGLVMVDNGNVLLSNLNTKDQNNPPNKDPNNLGNVAFEGYMNQLSVIPDMPSEFQIELYNTLQLSESERKIKNPNWDPKAILEGLPNCVKDAGQNAKGDEYKNELDACKGVNQVVPKYQLALQNQKFCVEPNNAMSIPYDDSEPNRPETLSHTNMVPFYRGTITQSLDPDNRLGTHKLEIFTGNYKLRQDNKQELGQFFAPTTGLSLPYGSHECRDLTRYNPNNTGKRNNEKPFQDIHVGPGLNKGFTNEGSGGFHDMLRIIPKRNDQMYVNPKSETKGMINHGKAVNENGTLRPVVYKYKTNLLVDNEAGQRNFSTVGAVTGRKLRPDIVLKDTNRVTSMPLVGPRALANKTLSTSANLIAKSKVSSKQNFANSPWRNLNQTTGKKHNDYSKSGIENRLTERSLYSDKNYWGHLKTWVNRVINDYTDKARHTRKQDNLCAERKTGVTSGNVGTSTSKKAGKVYDPRDVAKTTIKESTENFDYRGIISKGEYKGKAFNPRDVAKTTIKETTENLDYQGQVSRGEYKGKAYDPQDVTKTTIKETTENFDYQGAVSRGEYKGKAYDPQDVTKTTIKETTENLDYQGAVSRGEYKGKAYDSKDVAKTTVKETTENFDYQGAVSRGEYKGKAYDSNDVTKTTIKETTENFDYQGAVSRGEYKGKAYDPKDVAKTTVKETTENLDYKGQIGGAPVKKSIAYDEMDRAKTTIKETTENLDYKGVASVNNFRKGKAYDPTDVTKTTIRQTTEQNDYKGTANPVMHKKSIAYDPKDVTKTTIRQTTEQNDYLGGPSGESFQNGGAYETTAACAPATQRQFSLRSYAGGADAVNPGMTSYDSSYNMTFNPETELLVTDYAQQPAKVIPLNNNNTPGRYEVKKLEDDQVNRWTGPKQTSIENYFNPNAVTACTLTSLKNRLPEDFTRLDTRILDAYKNNPLTQSLNSYA